MNDHTTKNEKDDQNDKLSHMRHTASHVLAAASTELNPTTKLGVGPAIDNGFYHDIDVTPLWTEDDLAILQKKMEEIRKMNLPITHREVSKDEARTLFARDPYKLELIESIPEETVGVSEMGDGFFVTLCKGGHVASTGKIGYFKLTSLAGVYWQGDKNKQQLQRIYGIAFPTKEELKAHLALLTEAKKRDHRILGKQLDLFTFSPLVGPGLPLFTPRGTIIRETLLDFVRKIKERHGYKFVHVPHIAKAALYETSGHLGKYDAMMPTMKDDDGDEFVLKAMNCPHHFELFNAKAHSYRDLPLRLAENTAVYRNEKSGELSGLVRVASLTQDDTHHFVCHDQIEAEISMILEVMKEVYETFNFTQYHVQISVRDPNNHEKYFGDDALWSKAEDILVAAVQSWGAPYTIATNEAAFYGPKIDIMVKDAIGRTWQLTTVQLDFVQPENFAMRYIGEDGKKHAPAVLHVAILGSVERFMGILIEHYAGAFPLWLAPVQAVVLPVGAEQLPYAEQVSKELLANNIRVEIDSRNLTIGKKIREAQTMKVPAMLIVGKQEAADSSVTVRWRGVAEQDVMTIPKLHTQLTEIIASKE